MYLRLSFRNAKRSIFTYLLYIATMTILIAILCISNNLVVWGNWQAGFESASLPMIIGVIMVVLVNYINTFMLKQRAKELANYLLLGMEKRKLTQMFLTEFCLVGLLCFLLGALVGTVAFVMAVTGVLQGANIQPAQLGASVAYSFLFFAGIEVVCAVRVKRQLYRLQIRELMDEKYRNQPLKEGRKNFWAVSYVVSFLMAVLMLWGIVFLPENAAFPLISFISVPLIFSLFAFYKWLYGYLYAKRRLQAETLYQNNRLYHIAEMTKQAKTNPVMNGIFALVCCFPPWLLFLGFLCLRKK